jgi:thymidylate synthase (FAD)
MKLIKPSYQILTDINGPEILKRLEKHARVCYQSEDKITDGSAEHLLEKIIKSGHLSVIEHENISVRFIIDRGVSHETVRHRLCSFSQASTRYISYETGCTFIIPPWTNIQEGNYTSLNDVNSFNKQDRTWFDTMLLLESIYCGLLRDGWKPQQARSVLPNSLATTIDVTTNLREWRHIFLLRTSSGAHPQMREIMLPLLNELKEKLPVIFGDLNLCQNL